jgi:hypothetical protein
MREFIFISLARAKWTKAANTDVKEINTKIEASYVIKV